MSKDRLINKFINTDRFYWTYPIVLSTGLILRPITPDLIFSKLRKSYWVSSKNVINQTFAHHGNTIFLIVFVLLYLFKLSQQQRQQFTNSIKANPSIQLTKQYTIKLFLKYFGLWSLFYLIDHLFLLTGGSCLVTPEFTNVLATTVSTVAKCTELNGTWVLFDQGYCSLTPLQYGGTIKSAERCNEVGRWDGGFDISGHYCFLVTLSLILWNELKGLQVDGKSVDLEAQTSDNSTGASWFELSVVNGYRWLSLAVLLIWINMLFVTAMFYHTVLEKLLGLSFGYVTPLVMYVVIPKFVPVLYG